MRGGVRAEGRRASRTCVVPGGAGEDFVRGGRGEQCLGWDVKNPRFARWHTCSLCEQKHHGVVRCALRVGVLERRGAAGGR